MTGPRAGPETVRRREGQYRDNGRGSDVGHVGTELKSDVLRFEHYCVFGRERPRS